jgi:predicted metalloprotease
VKKREAQPMRRTGGIGIGSLILLLLLGWALGINPVDLIGGIDSSSETQQSQPAPGTTRTAAPSDRTGEFVSAILGSTEAQWKEIFAKAGKTYETPKVVMFSGATRSACGFAESAMGPLCPYLPRCCCR